MKIKNISEILFLPTLLAIGIVAGISGYISVFFTDGNLPTCLLGLSGICDSFTKNGSRFGAY